MAEHRPAASAGSAGAAHIALHATCTAKSVDTAVRLGNRPSQHTRHTPSPHTCHMHCLEEMHRHVATHNCILYTRASLQTQRPAGLAPLTRPPCTWSRGSAPSAARGASAPPCSTRAAPGRSPGSAGRRICTSSSTCAQVQYRCIQYPQIMQSVLDRGTSSVRARLHCPAGLSRCAGVSELAHALCMRELRGSRDIAQELHPGTQ